MKSIFLPILTLLLLTWPHEGNSRGVVSQDSRAPQNCVTCHAGLNERLSRSVQRSEKSAHSSAGVGCAECHGGDPAAPRGGTEHASFPGHPEPSEMASFCGRCHRSPLSMYAESGHARVRAAKPAVTCVDCHGSHDVGNPPRLFRLSQYCAACHGLEYLPALPSSLTELMETNDELTSTLLDRSEDPVLRRHLGEVRHLRAFVGRIVHRGSLDYNPAEVESGVDELRTLMGKIRQ